jgi:PAS domain S-box-containing protein
MSSASERPGCPLHVPGGGTPPRSGPPLPGFAVQLGILTLVVLAIAAGSIGWLVVRHYDDFLVAREVDRLGEGVRHKGVRIQAGIEGMRQDTLFLAGVPAVAGIVRARRAGGVDPQTGRTAAQWRANLAEVFSGLAAAKPHYLQVRFIGVADGGREIVRVDRVDGAVRATADRDLQAKGNRPYLRDAVVLRPGQVYVSPLELNREHGRLDPRMLRVIRTSTPVYGPDGTVFGAIVINIDFGMAASRLWVAGPEDGSTFVTDHRGVPMLAPGRGDAGPFGAPDRAAPIQDTLRGAADLFAPDSAAPSFSGLVDVHGVGQFAYMERVPLDPQHPDRFVAVGALIPRDAVLAPVRELHRRAAADALFATALLVLVAIAGGLALRRMRRQIRERDARLEAVVENAPNGILVVDRDGTLLQVNGRMEALTGYARDELIGRSVEMLVPERFREAHAAHRDGYFAAPVARTTKGEGDGDILLRRKDGTEIPVEVGLAPIHDGDAVTTIASVQDITERARFMAQLKASNKELDDFAYIASHDLKEPLRGIHHYATFLLEDYADRLDADGKDKLHTLTRLTQRMEDLINDLLTYSRLGRVDMARAETDVGALVRDVIDSLHVTLKERNVHVRVPAPLPTLHCDRVRVAEVFRNLVGNASKYNDSPEPTVEIGVTAAAPPPDGKGGPEAGRVFYVRDNGIGIPERHQAAIFNIFKRLHARDAYGGGTGAGLTIVKKIVEQHGGRIWIESAPGKGTTFYFTLNGDSPL